MVALDGSMIRNIVIHTVWHELVEALEDLPISPEEETSLSETPITVEVAE